MWGTEMLSTSLLQRLLIDAHGARTSLADLFAYSYRVYCSRSGSTPEPYDGPVVNVSMNLNEQEMQIGAAISSREKAPHPQK